MSQPFNSEETLRTLPTKIPQPLFNIGTNVCWDSSIDDPDCGLVMGMRYVWSKHTRDWQYQYYIALNTDSPSYQWAKFDWGWEEDLRLVLSKDRRSNSEDKNDR